jgi:hypothetical protein
MTIDHPPFVGLPDHPALAELKERDRWLCWYYRHREGREPTKPPLDPRTGQHADVSNSHTWAPYQVAERRARNRGLPGVGYVLGDGDGDLTGIDLDDVFQNGRLVDWARPIVACAETYSEFSPSGIGIRMVARGKIDQSIKCDAAGVEAYGIGRYLTITGNHLPGSPLEIRPAPRVLALLQERVASFRPPSRPANLIAAGSMVLPQADDERIAGALAAINADDRDVWLEIGMALHAHFGEAGKGLWNRWSQTSAKYDAQDLDRVWGSFNGSGITINTLFFHARAAGWKPKECEVRSAAGYFISRLRPRDAWQAFQRWHERNPITSRSYAEQIFESILDKEFAYEHRGQNR